MALDNTALLLPIGKPIERDRCYTEREIILELGWTSGDLERARKNNLRFKELAKGKRVYLGSWLLDWLEGRDAEAES